MLWLRQPVLHLVEPLDLRLALGLAAGILFVPSFALAGMALPIAVRLHARGREPAGRAALDAVVSGTWSPLQRHVPATNLAKLFFAAPGRLLLLGLGCGSIARSFAAGGILVVNAPVVGWNHPLARSLAATLEQVCAEVQALPVNEPPDAFGNVLLLASNRRLELRVEELPDPMKFLNDPEAHWAVVQMNHAWQNRFAPQARGAGVLTADWNPVDSWALGIHGAAARERRRFFGRDGLGW